MCFWSTAKNDRRWRTRQTLNRGGPLWGSDLVIDDTPNKKIRTGGCDHAVSATSCKAGVLILRREKISVNFDVYPRFHLWFYLVLLSGGKTISEILGGKAKVKRLFREIFWTKIPLKGLRHKASPSPAPPRLNAATGPDSPWPVQPSSTTDHPLKTVAHWLATFKRVVSRLRL
ncbi:hypothetical protein CJR79_25355 [Salmonella enterica]|nr:hypothetical protein [Salmonella enterica]